MCPDSPMQMCRMLCPPTNCPAGQCAMRHGSCCDMTCESPGATVVAVAGRPSISVGRPGRPTVVTATSTPPADCTSWHDGCNSCRVVDGQIAGCTKMMCARNDAPFCRAFQDGTECGDAACAQAHGASGALAEDDVCYRFCEDSSLPFVARRDDCPAGTTCRTTLPAGMAAFDSCHTPETCQRDGASGAPPTPPTPPPPASGKPHKRHMGGECNPALAEAQIGRVDQMCCQDGAQCPGGIPQSCNLECAAVFLPLYSDCPDLLAMHPNLQPHWDALADTCELAMASAIASNTDGGEAAFLVVEVDDGNSAQPPTVMVAMAEMPAPVADDGRGHRWPPAPTAPGCGRADALPWVMCSPQSPSDEFCSTHCYRGLAEFLERCSDTLSSDVEVIFAIF